MKKRPTRDQKRIGASEENVRMLDARLSKLEERLQRAIDDENATARNSSITHRLAEEISGRLSAAMLAGDAVNTESRMSLCAIKTRLCRIEEKLLPPPPKPRKPSLWQRFKAWWRQRKEWRAQKAFEKKRAFREQVRQYAQEMYCENTK